MTEAENLHSRRDSKRPEPVVPVSSVQAQRNEESRKSLESEAITIIIDAEPLEPFLRPARRRREATRHWIAMMLIGTLCLVVISFWILSICDASWVNAASGVFEKICFVLSPLVAFVLGWYYRRFEG